MTINTQVLEIQRGMLLHSQHMTEPVTPLRHFDLAGSPSYSNVGEYLIKQGKVGCILLAGGQGTRLKFDGPKGMYPTSPVYGKSLFQLFAEKVLAAGNSAGRTLPIAVMTSPENHDQTVDFFEKNGCFGLKPEQIDFFTQTTLPILGEQGELLKNSMGEIITGPDGNGSVFESFIDSGLKKKWELLGVEIINFISVDNPLADPFDRELIGYLQAREIDLAVKAVFRENPQENVGVLVEKEGKVSVVEYTELPNDQKEARDQQNKLIHRCANISLFALTLRCLEQHPMPLHLAHKAIPTITQPQPDSPNAWKFEKFIFDIFPRIERIGVLVYPREECFAPLKNFSGPDSIQTVQEALKQRDIKRMTALGMPIPEEPFELSQDYYY